jgi:dTDP-4-dehydrorhamnose reductase
MRILVVGAAGQVGGAFLRAATPRGHELWGGYVDRRPELPADRQLLLDKTRPDTIETAVARAAPDLVLDTGAFHAVDDCERRPAWAEAVNRDGTASLASTAARHGARFGFVSTDFVFGASIGRPRRETDPAEPVNVYGRTKLEGERAAVAAAPEAVIVRSSVIFSWIPAARRAATGSGKGVNFGSWIVDELRAGRSPSIVTDQLTSPTHADDLAGALVAVAESRISGVVHAAGASGVSRFELCQRVAAQLGVEASRIRPIRTAELRQLAVRPDDSRLDSSRLRELTGYRTWDLETSVGRLVRDAGAA